MSVVLYIRRPVNRQTDGQLGQYPGTHNVHVQIYGIPTVTLDLSTIPGRVRSTLSSKGWIVDNAALGGGWLQWGYTVDVFIQVFNEYDDETVKNNMVRDLAGTFDVTSISVVSSGYQAPSGPHQQQPSNQGGTPNAGLPPITINVPGAAAPGGATPTAPAGPSLFDGLATTLGVSAGVATLVAVVGIAVVLKSR